MEDWTTNPMNAVTAVLAIIMIVMLIWLVVLGRRLKKLRKQYTAVMGNTGVTNIEDVIIELKEQVALQQETAKKLQSQLSDVQTAIPQQKAKIGVHRYNAFAEQGSDLSFSIAIVNEQKDGAVISSIHSRETSYVYAKPLEKGESSYTLTPEEKKAVSDAK